LKEDRYYEDEIDLYEIWLTLKRRWRAIALSLLLFTLVALLYAFLSPPVYQVKHYFSEPLSPSVPSQVRSAVEVINSYLRDGDYGKLSALLGLDKEKLEKVISVEVPKIKNSSAVFTLIEEGKSLSVLKEFDSKLVSYLSSLPSISQQVEEKRRTIKAQLEDFSKRIGDMERLASTLKGQIERGNLKVVGFNPIELDTAIAKYKAEIERLRVELSSLSPFKEVSFFSSDKPIKPKRGLIVAVGAISGLFFGVFLALFLEWLEGVKRREEA